MNIEPNFWLEVEAALEGYKAAQRARRIAKSKGRS